MNPRPDADATRASHGRWPLWGGLLLVVAGISLLAYVGWELVGSNVVSEHRQKNLVDRTERAWDSPARSGSVHRGTLPGTAEALVRIPRFGAGYVMPVQGGVSEDVLAEGFGHVLDTAGPGQPGNYAIAAHRVTHGQPLRDMPELRPGDLVVVETRTRILTYVLDTDPNDLVVPFTASWVLDPHPVNPDGTGPQPTDDLRLLTMATCSELLHTDNRMIVFGHLVSVTPHDRDE